MTGEKLAKLMQLKTVSEGSVRELTGVYAGDILSRTVSRAGKGNVWITAAEGPELAIAARLADVSCIIVADGTAVHPELSERTKAAGISVYTSKKNISELTVTAARLLAKETEAGAWTRLLSDQL